MPDHTHYDLSEPSTDLPGHYIRRMQQIAVALFLEENKAFNITPVQFAALAGAAQQDGIDQRSLAGRIAFDPATIGGVIDRLESRDLLRRSVSSEDRRVRIVSATKAGKDLLGRLYPGVIRTQKRMLAPLTQAQQDTFLSLLKIMVDANNEFSRAPHK